ncbi:cell wall hydrolase [Bauldia litoralis]|uniref:cell wall hydrolase n=1 Tax=Bauldia litoralis TaxID=665467 RepID=UPI0032658508
MAKELPALMQGARRNIAPPKALTDAISYTLDRSYGPGYSFRVRSGIVDEPRGASGASKSGRHIMDSPGATDIQIYDPQGNQLAGADLKPFGQNWVSNFGSIGINATASDTRATGWTHVDFTQRPGAGTRVWNYGKLPKGMESEVEAWAEKGSWVDGKPSDDLALGLGKAAEELRTATIRKAADPSRFYASLWGREAIPKDGNMVRDTPGEMDFADLEEWASKNAYAATERTDSPFDAVIASDDPGTDKLARVMLAEARGEGPEGMAAVAQVAMNRVNDHSGRFPDSIDEVLNNEFAAPIDPGKVTPEQMAEAKQIASAVQSGTMRNEQVGNALYFMNPKTSTASGAAKIRASGEQVAQIGDHVFYGTPTVSGAESTETMVGGIQPLNTPEDYATGRTLGGATEPSPRINTQRDRQPSGAPRVDDLLPPRERPNYMPMVPGGGALGEERPEAGVPDPNLRPQTGESMTLPEDYINGLLSQATPETMDAGNYRSRTGHVTDFMPDPTPAPPREVGIPLPEAREDHLPPDLQAVIDELTGSGRPETPGALPAAPQMMSEAERNAVLAELDRLKAKAAPEQGSAPADTAMSQAFPRSVQGSEYQFSESPEEAYDRMTRERLEFNAEMDARAGTPVEEPINIDALLRGSRWEVTPPSPDAIVTPSQAAAVNPPLAEGAMRLPDGFGVDVFDQRFGEPAQTTSIIDEIIGPPEPVSSGLDIGQMARDAVGSVFPSPNLLTDILGESEPADFSIIDQVLGPAEQPPSLQPWDKTSNIIPQAAMSRVASNDDGDWGTLFSPEKIADQTVPLTGGEATPEDLWSGGYTTAAFPSIAPDISDILGTDETAQPIAAVTPKEVVTTAPAPAPAVQTQAGQPQAATGGRGGIAGLFGGGQGASGGGGLLGLFSGGSGLAPNFTPATGGKSPESGQAYVAGPGDGRNGWTTQYQTSDGSGVVTTWTDTWGHNWSTVTPT